MSLKKQVKELKADVNKKDEELLLIKKNMKQTRIFELENEIKVYKDELLRMRYLCEQVISKSKPDDKKVSQSIDSFMNGGIMGAQSSSLSQG